MRRALIGALLLGLGLAGCGNPTHPKPVLPSHTPTPLALPTPRIPPSFLAVVTPTAVVCSGPALTAQSQVRANASYCGGVVHSRIALADGDTWTNGSVSGASAGKQDGAIHTANHDTLVNMTVGPNPDAWAGVQVRGDGVTILGGRFTGNADLGIGGGKNSGLLIDGAEVDHNGASASCGFEGGGFKGVNHNTTIRNSYFHDNRCPGIWFDINASAITIANNRIVNNASMGIFFEISQDAKIYGNTLSGNGFHFNFFGCPWLWGGGITVASSFNVEIHHNTLVGNCNGITGTQQDRTDSTPPDHLLANLSIHDNSVSGSGKTGVAEDNGADLTTRDIVYAANHYISGQAFCGLDC